MAILSLALSECSNYTGKLWIKSCRFACSADSLYCAGPVLQTVKKDQFPATTWRRKT